MTMSESVTEINESGLVRGGTGNSGYKVHRALNWDERILSLFEPDAVVSAQYFESLRSKTLLEPEKKLMLAVLEDAISCFQHNALARSGKSKKLFEESEAWILAGDRDWFFSFENICDVLKINPAYVRQGLLRWKERTLRIGTPSSRRGFAAVPIAEAN
jgi:hypothetical protein